MGGGRKSKGNLLYFSLFRWLCFCSLCDNWRLAAEFLLLVLSPGPGVKLNVTNAISSHKIILFHSIIAPNMPDVICIQYEHTQKERGEREGQGQSKLYTVCT